MRTGCAPILAWRRTDPDATIGHAPAQHPRPLLRGYRVHTLLCRGSGLPVFFLLSPANVHDAPFARPRLQWAMRLYQIRPRIIRLDAAYWDLRLIAWIHDQRGTGPAHFHRTLLWPRLSVLSLAASTLMEMVSHRAAGRLDLRRFHYCWAWPLSTQVVLS